MVNKMSSVVASAGSPGWVDDLFAAIDAMDTGRFLTYLSENARFRFGSNDVVTGREAIGQAVDAFFASIGGLEHRLLETWVHPTTTVCQGEVTYTRKDGSKVTLPFVDVFRMDGELVQEYLIHMDIGPLFSQG